MRFDPADNDYFFNCLQADFAYPTHCSFPFLGRVKRFSLRKDIRTPALTALQPPAKEALTQISKMLARTSFIQVLTAVLTASTVVVARPADTSPSDLTFQVEKRSCPTRWRQYSWNAGCSAHWAGRCHSACGSQAPSKGCCQDVESLIADKCGWVSKNCYCDCKAVV